jgi:Putative Flp pilus-assembly TadE/G-like
MSDHRRRCGHGFTWPAGDVHVERRAGERGQILPLTCISLIAICAVVGVAIDLGYFLDYRRQMQTAADDAAMAGAAQLWRGGSDTEVISAASNGAASNAFTDGANATRVTVNHPPVNGFYAGNPGFVEAIISQPRPTIFMGILGFQTATVSARAVAGAARSPNCIYALHPTANQAFNTTGSALVNASCGVVVDSSSSSAMNSSGSAGVNATSIAVTGNTSGCCFSPTPQTGVPPAPDPLAGRVAPTVSGCNYTNFKVSGATRTLTPGVYCNGIDISGGSSNVTFMPGVYVLNGGGFTVSGGGAIQGDGVTFYNTGGGAYAYKPVAISGGTTGTLSAPESGSTEGILFFQDRTITTNANNAISGASTLNIKGALYFPTQHVDFSGGSSGSTGCNIIVASTITFSGPSSLSVAGCSDFANGSPIKKVALGE